jgi:Poly(A) polymerase catalytic subunit
MSDDEPVPDSVYETIALRADPVYEGIDEIIEVLEKFIRDRGLIIYGGLAIDYALRLHGDKIYPDDLLQIDYDFLSPDSVNHARELADLFQLQRDDIRAINAMHVGTTKVDIGSNHFLADVSYVPPAIFHKLPTVEWRGLKCIHPDLQRVDAHHSLAFPYEGAPQESIFNRWRKDVKRFALMTKYYPLVHPVCTYTAAPMRMIVTHDFVLGGEAAYAAMYTVVKQDGGDVSGCVVNTCTYDDGFVTYASMHGACILSQRPERAIDALGVKSAVKYAEFHNFTPALYRGMAAFGECIIVDTSEDLVSVVTWHVGKKSIRLASAQWLSMWFLGQYHRARIEGAADADADTYLHLYTSVQQLIATGHPITALSVDVYGDENTNMSKKVMLARDLHNAGKDAPVYVQPTNYHPSKGNATTFEYGDNPIYQKSGEVIT